MRRDIDYAAAAVKRAIVEKFSPSNQMERLHVEALETTICVADAGRRGEGTRDNLLASVRAAASYDELWQLLDAPATPSPQRQATASNRKL